MVVASGHAMQIAWGPQRIILYNDTYIPMLGHRHPLALGVPFRDAWPEIWPDIEPLVDDVFAGKTVKFDDMPLLMTRHGYPEETWWSFSYSPLREQSGAVGGLLNVTVDATGRHRAERAELERDAATALLQRNEARFRALVTAGGSSIYRMSADWRLMYQLDSETLKTTSDPTEDWMEKYILDEDLSMVREAMNNAIRSKSLFELEHRILTADHQIAWVLSRAVPILDQNGNVSEWFGTASDVTSRRSMEERLRVKEELYSFLLELSDTLRTMSDPTGMMTSAARLLGEKLQANRVFYANADTGGNYWLVVPGFQREISPLPEQPFEMSAYGGWIIEGFNDGKSLIVHDMASDDRFSTSERLAHLALGIQAKVAVPFLKDGQLVAVLVVHAASPHPWSELELTLLHEAADRTWSAIERARAEIALHEADRNKDEFLAVLGHELRNGLAPLVYNAEIGNRSPGDTALAKTLFEKAGRQLHHLARLVDDLLDVARINIGKIDLDLEVVGVREVVALALDACRPDIDRKHHRLAIAEDGPADLAVRGDRIRLTQIVWNLLSNATKYMDAEGSISVRMAREGDEAVIEVTDTGIGIPQEALAQVFDLFSQVRDRQGYTAGGLGIGLALVKQLVEMQGGKVKASSDGLGHGSQFTVRFPVANADAGNEMAASRSMGSGGQGMQVLIVDDQRDSADSLAQLLRLELHTVTVVYDGENALRAAHHRRPDVVLLDLGMPGFDGFKVARRLRDEFSTTPPMRIVAVTGWGQDTDRQLTKAAGFDGHLTKPPSNAELSAILSPSFWSANSPDSKLRVSDGP